MPGDEWWGHYKGNPFGHVWREAGNWSGVRHSTDLSSQNFSLPKPTIGRFWQLTVGPSFASHQGIIRELYFETTDGWMANIATEAHTLPVVGASTWQPGVTGDGAPYCAMDGNVSTAWDPASGPAGREGDSGPATLEIDFARNQTILSIAVVPFGPGFNPVSFHLQTAVDSAGSQPHKGWRSYPQVPVESISLQPRTPFETFDPMELVANSTEVADMLERHKVKFAGLTQNLRPHCELTSILNGNPYKRLRVGPDSGSTLWISGS
jgi:hypothetical protein